MIASLRTRRALTKPSGSASRPGGLRPSRQSPPNPSPVSPMRMGDVPEFRPAPVRGPVSTAPRDRLLRQIEPQSPTSPEGTVAAGGSPSTTCPAAPERIPCSPRGLSRQSFLAELRGLGVRDRPLGYTSVRSVRVPELNLDAEGRVECTTAEVVNAVSLYTQEGLFHDPGDSRQVPEPGCDPSRRVPIYYDVTQAGEGSGRAPSPPGAGRRP